MLGPTSLLSWYETVYLHILFKSFFLQWIKFHMFSESLSFHKTQKKIQALHSHLKHLLTRQVPTNYKMESYLYEHSSYQLIELLLNVYSYFEWLQC